MSLKPISDPTRRSVYWGLESWDWMRVWAGGGGGWWRAHDW